MLKLSRGVLDVYFKKHFDDLQMHDSIVLYVI